MKRKLLKAIGITVLFLAIVLGNVLAFSLGTTDGVWGQVDSTGGGAIDATCMSYGAATSASYTLYDVAGVLFNINVGPGGEDEVYTRKASVCAGDIDGDMSWADWNRTTTISYTGLGYYSGCASTTGLFISEIVYDDIKGQYDRLGIEIYNGTGATVNLNTSGNQYSLLLFHTDKDFDKIDLTGTIQDKGVYVVANTAMAAQITTENKTFSNNDYYRTVVLMNNYTPQVVNAASFGWPETVQAGSSTDENQVRYGQPSGYNACPTNGDITGFKTQSGFGFKGQQDSSFDPVEGQYFPVGRFCHYNLPISASNDFEQVPLFLKINNIGCPAGQGYVPDAPDQGNALTFEYRVNLDETVNNTSPCKYTPDSPGFPSYGNAKPNQAGDLGPNRNGCADAISWTSSGSNYQTFRCSAPNPPYAPIVTQYTVSILGFTPVDPGAVCPDVPSGTIQFNKVYTAEKTTNCFCVYAAYTKGQITPVVLKDLTAEGAEGGILITWNTVTETNNLGFNIMRAESIEGEQTQINPELIMSEFAPGDMFGAAYEYLDETAAEGVTYYYWLIDVPLNSGDQPGVYGPISAVR